MEAQMDTSQHQADLPSRDRMVGFLQRFDMYRPFAGLTDDELLDRCREVSAREKARAIEREAREREEALKRANEWRAARGVRYARASLDTFEITVDPRYRPAQIEYLAALRDYEEHLEERFANGVNIWLGGSVGVGKTHAAYAIGWSVIAKNLATSVCVVRGAELYAEARDAMQDGSESRLLNAYGAKLCLILDDPIGTTNIVSQAEADERLGAAIVDRLQHNALVLTAQWPSFRTQKGSR